MWTPFLTAYDPGARSDGSIDPLGLQADASRLADMLLPGFTVRMERLRALTVSAFVLEVAKQLAPNAGLALPYRLCLERLVLAAIAEQVEKTTDAPIRGFPGRLKALSARVHGDPLTLERYIRGPATNGVVGAYTTLARSGGVVDEELNLRSRGDALLDSWAADCKLPLRDSGLGGSKSDLRKVLERAVTRDVESRRFDPATELRAALFQALRLDEIGARERRVLESALMDPVNGVQPRVLELLRGGALGHRDDEREADDDVSELPSRGVIEHKIVASWQHLDGSAVDALVGAGARLIIIYERAAAHVFAPFEAFRWLCVGSTGTPLPIGAIEADSRTKDIAGMCAERLPSLIDQLEGATRELEALPQKPVSWPGALAQLRRTIERFRLLIAPSGTDLLSALLTRHEEVQRAKRKGSWVFEQGGAFRFVAGPPISDREPIGPQETSFMHAFRLVNAMSILSDLEA